MKNTQRGFIVPLLLIIIALLLVGGGAYIYTQKKEASPTVSGNVEFPQATSTEQTTTVTTKTTTGTTNVLPVNNNNRSWCHTFVSNLKIDDGGSEVRFLDIALQKEKVGTPHSFEGQAPTLISDDGRFIADTASAVMAFQAKYSLTKTGIVDSATRAKLNSLYGCTITQPSVTVLSPNGGELWPIGSTQTIRWANNGFSNGVVSFELIDSRYNAATEDNQTHLLIANIVPNTGSYVWTPSSSFGPSGAVTPGSQYKIRISAYKTTSAGLLDYDNLVQGDVSNTPFSITQ